MTFCDTSSNDKLSQKCVSVAVVVVGDALETDTFSTRHAHRNNSLSFSFSFSLSLFLSLSLSLSLFVSLFFDCLCIDFLVFSFLLGNLLRQDSSVFDCVYFSIEDEEFYISNSIISRAKCRP